MAPRRSHAKSRNGCDTCRRRRVKCDETGPPCTRCVARELLCAYSPSRHHTNPGEDVGPGLDPKSLRKSNSHSLSESIVEPTTISNEMSTKSLGPRSKMQLRELELLHQYTASSHRSLGEVFDVPDHVWQVFVVQEAFKHDFLLNGVLSIAALHTASEHGGLRSVNTVSAAEYLEAGLRTYRTLLYHTSTENLHAVFAFGIVVCVNMLVHLQSSITERTWSDLVDKLNGLFECLNAVCRLVAAGEEQLLAGPFGSLLLHLRQKQVTCSDPGIRAALVSLKKLSLSDVSCLQTSISIPRKQFYDKIIDGLEACWVREAYVLDWLPDAGKRFQADLQRGETISTLLLSFWGVALHRLNRYWFINGLGKTIVDMATENLRTTDKQATASIAWARAQVGLT